MRSVALEGCSATIAEDDGRVSLDDATLCGCDGQWTGCEAPVTASSPSLFGYGPCDPESQVCLDYCQVDLVALTGSRALPGFVLHAAVPGAALKKGQDDGCVEFAFPPRRIARGVATLAGYTPVSSVALSREPGRFAIGRGAMVRDLSVIFQAGVVGDRPGELPDVRNALLLPIQVCEPPELPVKASNELCLERGVADVAVDLLYADGSPIRAPWAKPRYIGEAGVWPDPEATATTTAGTAYFWNVPPGEYLVRLRDPPRGRLSCTMDGGTGVTLGGKGDDRAALLRLVPLPEPELDAALKRLVASGRVTRTETAGTAAYQAAQPHAPAAGRAHAGRHLRRTERPAHGGSRTCRLAPTHPERAVRDPDTRSSGRL